MVFHRNWYMDDKLVTNFLPRSFISWFKYQVPHYITDSLAQPGDISFFGKVLLLLPVLLCISQPKYLSACLYQKLIYGWQLATNSYLLQEKYQVSHPIANQVWLKRVRYLCFFRISIFYCYLPKYHSTQILYLSAYLYWTGKTLGIEQWTLLWDSWNASAASFTVCWTLMLAVFCDLSMVIDLIMDERWWGWDSCIFSIHSYIPRILKVSQRTALDTIHLHFTCHGLGIVAIFYQF